MEGEPRFEEEKDEQKRLSPISRIVGLSEEGEREMHKNFEEIFENKKFDEAERVKTPEEEEMIKDILEKMPEFIKKYGGKPIDSITPNHIHFLDKNKMAGQESDDVNLSGASGAYNPVAQFLYIIDGGNTIRNANTVCHELFHLNSFQSVWFRDYAGEEAFQIRRIGFEVHSKNDGDTVYFHELNEAITEELAIRFDQKYFEGIGSLSKEALMRKRFIENAGFVKELLQNAQSSYHAERSKLNKIVKDIFEKNSDKFESQEEVFDEFARAYFTGRMLPIARLVEKTYGKGSFRKIAEETKKVIHS